MTAADKNTLSAADPREAGTQLRPGLWQTINERYPGSMIRKESWGTAILLLRAPMRALEPDQ
jgi:hypothetical protein